MDKNKLLYFIKDRKLSVKEFCTGIGMSYSSFYKKLSCLNFDLREIRSIGEFLNLTLEEITSIFFADYVSETETV